MKLLLLASSVSLLAACSEIPPEAYFDRGSPESLLDVSSEVVNISLASSNALGDISGWLENSQPVEAEVKCTEGNNSCIRALELLESYDVPITYIPAESNNVVLIYERVVARDCESRFISNHINPYNLNHPTFGCSIAANMVQHVSDRQQFTNPELLDFHDAEKAVQNVYKYRERTEIEEIEESQLGGGGTGGGGGGGN